MTLQTTPPTQTQCQQYLSCFWPHFNETLNVGYWEHLEQYQLSWWYLSRQHLSISTISQLFLIQFWWNIICRFLGTSRTDSSCHSVICPGIFCLGDIYQLLLTQFLWNFKCRFLWLSLKDANCFDYSPGQGEVKGRSRRGQGKVERQGQGNHNYNLMDFDTIEINLVQSIAERLFQSRDQSEYTLIVTVVLFFLSDQWDHCIHPGATTYTESNVELGFPD